MRRMRSRAQSKTFDQRSTCRHLSFPVIWKIQCRRAITMEEFLAGNGVPDAVIPQLKSKLQINIHSGTCWNLLSIRFGLGELLNCVFGPAVYFLTEALLIAIQLRVFQWPLTHCSSSFIVNLFILAASAFKSDYNSILLIYIFRCRNILDIVSPNVIAGPLT